MGRAAVGQCFVVWVGLVGLACGGTKPVAESADAAEPGAPTPAGDAPPAAACKRPHEFGPVVTSDAAYAERHGAASRTFSSLVTSEATPLEDCGLELMMRRLVTLTCNDGSRPFGDDLRAAHASRRGSVGAGGRCGSILDLYEVTCPEGPYRVFADMYVCTEAGAATW